MLRLITCTTAALIIVLSAGCAGRFAKRTTKLEPPVGFSAVFVFPVTFKGATEPPYRVFEVSQRLVDQGVRAHGDRLAFFGPTEFKVLRPDGGHGWVTSTALPVLLKAGHRPEQGLVMRAIAERRVTSASQQAEDAKGEAKGGHSNEITTWLVTVEIAHPSTTTQVLEVSGQTQVDPFQPRPESLDFDPEPELSLLLQEVTKEALEAIAGGAISRPQLGPELSATLALTPRSALAWAEGSPGAEAQLAPLDELARDLLLQNRARFAAPYLSDAEAAKLRALPPGLVVVAAPEGGKISPGDVIVEVEGQPALLQVLARQRLKGLPSETRVRRSGGALADVLLP